MSLVKTSARLGDDLHALVCSNVGPGGAYFATRATPPPGTRLAVQLRAPGHNAPLIDVLAEVVWTGRETPTQPAGVGVRWLRADSAVGAEPLRALLRGLMRMGDLGDLERATSTKASFDFVAHQAAKADDAAIQRRALAASMRPMVLPRTDVVRDTGKFQRRTTPSGLETIEPDASSVMSLRTDSVVPGQSVWERRAAQRRGSGLRTFATPTDGPGDGVRNNPDLSRTSPTITGQHQTVPAAMSHGALGAQPGMSPTRPTGQVPIMAPARPQQATAIPTNLPSAADSQPPARHRTPTMPMHARVAHVSDAPRRPPSVPVRPPPPMVPATPTSRHALAVEPTLSHAEPHGPLPRPHASSHHPSRTPAPELTIQRPTSGGPHSQVTGGSRPLPPRISSSQISATSAGIRLPKVTDSEVHAVSARSWPVGVPRTLADRYADLTLLGQGGHGVVFRALDLLLERLVVLKFLAGTGMAADQARRYFLREFKVTADLIHPNIVRLYDIGSADGTLYYTMEYVPGHTLGHYLGKNARMEDHTFVYSVFSQLAAALDHAHAHHVLHRDVKPNNVLVADDGSVRLFDFGLARLLADGTQDQSMVVGTPFYMAPEMQRTSPVDHRADQYALGVVLYRMLTGRVPFADGNVFLAHAIAPVPDPRVFHAELPGAVSPILLKMLAKEPEDRFPDCAAAAMELYPVLVRR